MEFITFVQCVNYAQIKSITNFLLILKYNSSKAKFQPHLKYKHITNLGTKIADRRIEKKMINIIRTQYVYVSSQECKRTNYCHFGQTRELVNEYNGLKTE